MWISKRKYDSLKAENAEYLDDHNMIQTIRTWASMDDRFVPLPFGVGGGYLLSNEAFRKFCDEATSNADTIRQLTAERDWYKQKYAEMICDKETV